MHSVYRHSSSLCALRCWVVSYQVSSLQGLRGVLLQPTAVAAQAELQAPLLRLLPKAAAAQLFQQRYGLETQLTMGPKSWLQKQSSAWLPVQPACTLPALVKCFHPARRCSPLCCFSEPTTGSLSYWLNLNM